MKEFIIATINCTNSQYGNVGDLIIIKKDVYTPIDFEPLTDASTEESAAEKLKEIKECKNIQDWMNTLEEGSKV